MSNRIQEFFNEKFGEVRAVTINGIVYFFGVDITIKGEKPTPLGVGWIA